MLLTYLTRRTAFAALLPLAACATAPAYPSWSRRLVRGRHGAIDVLTTGPRAGDTIVMIPSLGRGAEDFRLLAEAVAAAGFKAVCPQPRGFGSSAPYAAGVRLDDLADDTAEVIEALAPQRSVIVLGHAFGNRVARKFSARRPDLVRAVILLAAGGKVAMAPDIEQSLVASFDLSLPDGERMEHVARAFFAPGNDPSVWRDGWRRDVAEIQIEATRRTPVDTWWEAGKAPILVVQPLQDVLAPPENAEALRAAAPQRVQVVAIDGAGHALLPEQPEAVARAVIGFARQFAASAPR
jgi:pimeloyl-ACP methyl ester carboxylesterase